MRDRLALTLLVSLLDLQGTAHASDPPELQIPISILDPGERVLRADGSGSGTRGGGSGASAAKVAHLLSFSSLPVEVLDRFERLDPDRVSDANARRAVRESFKAGLLTDVATSVMHFPSHCLDRDRRPQVMVFEAEIGGGICISAEAIRGMKPEALIAPLMQHHLARAMGTGQLPLSVSEAFESASRVSSLLISSSTPAGVSTAWLSLTTEYRRAMPVEDRAALNGRSWSCAIVCRECETPEALPFPSEEVRINSRNELLFLTADMSAGKCI